MKSKDVPGTRVCFVDSNSYSGPTSLRIGDKKVTALRKEIMKKCNDSKLEYAPYYEYSLITVFQQGY